MLTKIIILTIIITIFIAISVVVFYIYKLYTIDNKDFIHISKGTKDLLVKQSTFPNTGLGCFTNKDFKKNSIIDEYKGKLYINQTIKDTSKTWDSLNHTIDGIKYKKISVDGFHYAKKNPLIYANGASLKDQFNKINCKVSFLNGKCYYKAHKDIKKGEELIIDYGKKYFIDRNMPYEKNKQK